MRKRFARTPTIATVIIVAGLFVLGGSAFALRGLGGADDESDAAKNERILKNLVPPTGAHIVTKQSGPSYESTSEITERKTGYATDLEYNVPKSVSSPQWVADFYARQLHGWKRHEEVIPCEESFGGEIPTPCRDLVIDVFTKGDTRVSLNIDGFEGRRPWGYELTIMQRDR